MSNEVSSSSLASNMSYEASSSSQASNMSYKASSSSPQWKYDVFLSFCDQDTRTNFIDFLYNWLVWEGIHIFGDKVKLNKSFDDIPTEWMEVIEGSRIAIIVFSKNYASSTWCLNELAKIMDCKNKNQIKEVLPVFYKVDPSDVKTYAQAFKNHEENFKDEMAKVETWKSALKEAGSLSGWNEEMVANGLEAELTKKIVEKVWRIVKKPRLHVADHPIGLDSHIARLNCLLNDDGLNAVCIIGIYGLGGTGKTTIAKVIYNVMSSNFEGSIFLANVREDSKRKGLASFEEQLSGVLKRKEIYINNEDQGIDIIRRCLSKKRVLIVIDDIEERNQFYKLVGGKDCFSLGSRIILTSRDAYLFDSLDVYEKYKYSVETMNQYESLQLFSHHAFRQNHPLEDYVQLSNEVVHYAGGLPLALVILGSLLYKRSQVQWESELKKLREMPNDKILEKLEISFGALDDSNRTIFLDISCFFIGKEKKFVIKILDACGLDGEAGIKLLTERSLITVDRYHRLHMHDLICDMGREIVRKQSPQKPGGRSRLWDSSDAIDALINLTGSDEVEGLQLFVSECNVKELGQLTIEGFSKMPNLKLLEIVNSSWFHVGINLQHFLQEGVFCFKNLVWLNWKTFPFKYIPNNFHFGNLIILNMEDSKLEEVWKGTKYLRKLKELNLRRSFWLTRTPIFSGLPNLEKLILNDCGNLVKVHESINHLKNLIHLDLGDCKKVRNLPSGIYSCSKLETLNVEGCSFNSLPMLPSSLRFLDATGCIKLKMLPNLSNLKQLKTLNLSWCLELTEIDGIEGLECATSINLNGCLRLKSSVKERFFQDIFKYLGNHAACDVILDRIEVPEWVGFEFQSESSDSLSFSVTQPTYNMEGMLQQQQGLILFIVFSTWKDEDYLTFTVHNESKNFQWRYGIEYNVCCSKEKTITWVIKIPNSKWKSIAEYGDNINVSVQRRIPRNRPCSFGEHNKVKKIGVCFFYASHTSSSMRASEEENCKASPSSSAFNILDSFD